MQRKLKLRSPECIKSIGLLLISVIFLSSCTTSSVKSKVGETSLINDIVNAYHANIDEREIDSISILSQQGTECDDNTIFVEIHQQGMMDSAVYKVGFSNGNIVNSITETAAIGLSNMFRSETIKITQGTYIAAYCASHMGNGTLNLIPISDCTRIQYSFPAVGMYAGECEQLENSDQLNALLAKETKAADLRGHLDASYLDVSSDGYSDVVLSGILQVIDKVEKYYCEFYFIYDSKNDTFIFSDDSSTIIQVS